MIGGHCCSKVRSRGNKAYIIVPVMMETENISTIVLGYAAELKVLNLDCHGNYVMHEFIIGFTLFFNFAVLFPLLVTLFYSFSTRKLF